MNIFVGNLSFDSKQEEIKELFEQFGSVSGVNLIKDRETGRSRGFCFVEMENKEEAEKAISALNETPVRGRNIRVNEARPREFKPRSSSRDE